MPGKGYKVLSVKEEVVTKIQDRAKKEEVSISKLLDNLLERSSIYAVKTSVNDVADKEGLTKEDFDNALLGLENDIDMKIRDMVEELKRGGL